MGSVHLRVVTTGIPSPDYINKNHEITILPHLVIKFGIVQNFGGLGEMIVSDF